jgi:hypothetical protein
MKYESAKGSHSATAPDKMTGAFEGGRRDMQKVFSSRELSETVLVRDALVHQGIEVFVQNEHSNHTAVPEFRPPAEIWIVRDTDYEEASRLIKDTLSTIDSRTEAAPWQCAHCKSENPASFELCWSCGKERGTPMFELSP